ncbi:MAG: hypothetical protein JNK38_13750 [Acidobacteria bacterium]|nr:hypothetical protein [Acidobacteriota bacterium]
MSHRHNRFLALFALALLVCLSLAGVASTSVSASPQKKDKEAKETKKDKKAKKASNAPTAPGTPKLWEDRGNIASLNLVYGIGNPEGMPKPPFQFDKEDVTGTNPKIKVIDANGIKWNIKFDEEVHAEVAASRIVWACGYMVEESYFMPSGKVNGVTGLGRAKKFVGSDGSFTNGMFEKRPDDIARRAINWDWTSNPFNGSKELSGLAILNALLNNWDAKTTNNNVLGMFDDDGKVIDWYLVADWGGAFGKMGGFMSHTKWDLADYQKQAFLDGVSGGQLKLHYSGKMSSNMKSVPLEHARWFAGIIGQLTDAQIQDAFKTAGASPAEVEGFSRRIRQKINELKSAVGR